MTAPRSTLSLIGDRYLDTQHDPSYIEGLERELASRGVVGAKRWALEVYAAGGLWWNVLWWEWCDLDGRDMRVGWTLNLVIGGLVSAAIGYCFGVSWGFATAAALLTFAIWVGLSLRGGTIAAEPEA